MGNERSKNWLTGMKRLRQMALNGCTSAGKIKIDVCHRLEIESRAHLKRKKGATCATILVVSFVAPGGACDSMYYIHIYVCRAPTHVGVMRRRSLSSSSHTTERGVGTKPVTGYEGGRDETEIQK